MTTPVRDVDLDLRLVRYFLAVAEHMHFSRAAEELRINQPTLSRQIRRLESQLGAALLERTSRGTTLTSAVESFLPYAHSLLRTAQRARRGVQGDLSPTSVRVGYIPGITVTQPLRKLRSEYPDTGFQAVHLRWFEQQAALLDHRVDLVVGLLPFPTDDLLIIKLYEEPRSLLVAADHPLAGRDSVALKDFATEPMPRFHNLEWDAFWRINPRPDGSSAPTAPEVQSLEDKIELVASGQAVLIGAEGFPGPRLRADIRRVPIHGIEPARVVMAVRATRGSQGVLPVVENALARHLTSPPA